MTISKGNTIIYTETLEAEILPRLEIVSISLPEKIPQGTPAYFVIIIQNNQGDSEEFRLYINEGKVKTDIDELVSGKNRIEVEVPVQEIYNPYEFGIKVFKIKLEDSLDETIVKDYFDVEIELSSFNLVIFYLIPIIVPIGIILYHKNKLIKHKLLKR